jgi:hypothetical protein
MPTIASDTARYVPTPVSCIYRIAGNPPIRSSGGPDLLLASTDSDDFRGTPDQRVKGQTGGRSPAPVPLELPLSRSPTSKPERSWPERSKVDNLRVKLLEKVKDKLYANVYWRHLISCCGVLCGIDFICNRKRNTQSVSDHLRKVVNQLWRKQWRRSAVAWTSWWRPESS